MGAHTDPRLAIDSGDMDRLRYCTHHDPHSIYGAHVVDCLLYTSDAADDVIDV